MKKEYDFSEGRRGPVVRVPKGKTRITIRIDSDILSWFRGQIDLAGGGSYQALMNHALREYIESTSEPLEETIRRVVREEHVNLLERLESDEGTHGAGGDRQA